MKVVFSRGEVQVLVIMLVGVKPQTITVYCTAVCSMWQWL